MPWRTMPFMVWYGVLNFKVYPRADSASTCSVIARGDFCIYFRVPLVL